MPETTWKSGRDVLEDDRIMERIADGVHAAGNPYYDWIFGGAEIASAALRDWIRRPTSEAYAGRARLLFEGETLVGGVIGLSGAECRAARLADAVALMALAKGPARAEMMARLEGSKGKFGALRDDDWYVSKMWVDREFRGKAKGYALTLTEAVLYPPSPEFHRALADAWADNTPALRIYARLGCTIIERHTLPNGIEYVTFVGPPRR